MEIRPKLYPYPVLSYYSDDYVDSSVDKDTSDLLNTPSVFSIIKNDDEMALGMVVDFIF